MMRTMNQQKQVGRASSACELSGAGVVKTVAISQLLHAVQRYLSMRNGWVWIQRARR
jgi:hypothetical protein